MRFVRANLNLHENSMGGMSWDEMGWDGMKWDEIECKQGKQGKERWSWYACMTKP